ncbi:GmrSD restriction endonuclease domain-containing protein [Tateyamaria pelophila]|uniref:GmrSD restriction endonuclease domain-containing protein n=1 Tax=Tateyamaria pelophila TaxID=328415 RepID=UPI001CBE2871|nr:DUF262 domain-containing protein [Tateyamaria pelophila]
MSQTTQRFSSETPPIHHLIQEIDMGNLGLPDLQRPFVWKRARIRDLFDSLYQGFPAGYFLFWNTPKKIDSHSIGIQTDTRENQKMIVDGQQRLTSLYAVMKGKPILNEASEEQLIRIAFNPLTEEFSVANASSDNNPAFISNISDIWTSGKGSFFFINEFIQNLKESQDIDSHQESQIAENIQQLENIRNYQFSVLVLSAELDVDTVAEIFQRINAGGIPLNSADFILTLMSVYWVEGRHQLEDFARKAKIPSTNHTASPYNVFHAPSPDQLLRVAVGLGLKRGVLQNAYQILRGRDPIEKKVKEDLRDARFADLKEAQAKVLNLADWHEYINCLKAAGFRSRSMLTSANNFLYGYLIFLIGKHEFGVERKILRATMSRWFFMSALTGRYTGSPETILEADLRRMEQAKKTSDGFVQLLENLISNQLTDDYWKVTLPERLDTSSAYSPYLFGYHAALNLLGATALFSKIRISDLLDPAVTGTKSPVERHHLFPKAYLRSLGFTGTYRLNQIANYAFVEWADNISISDTAPADYFPSMFYELTDQEKANASYWHALPDLWYNLEYLDFTQQRRKLIARIIRDGFGVLTGDVTPNTNTRLEPSVAELLTDMETLRIEFKSTARVPLSSDVPEKVVNEGIIKTVAAFMNSEGGTLGIGISDDGDILGIQKDLDYKKQDIDGYQNWLSTLLMNAIGQAVVAKNTSIRFELAEDSVVCLIDVSPSSSPVYADTVKGKELFYVRIGNTTRILSGSEMVEYINSHF